MLPNKDLLTPGPWRVNGNTVKDAQGRTICVVFARHATAHAHWIAEIPELADREVAQEQSEEQDDETMELLSEIADLKADLKDADEDIAALEAEVAALRKQIQTQTK